MKIISQFIVFEGCDGSGTTTQLNLLAERMRENNITVFPTFEPTRSNIGQLIRSALSKDNSFKVKPETLALLFAADRNEHIFGADGILEHANNREIVVCDRYVLSSLVYQGVDCGDELPALLNSGFPIPEITFYLEINPSNAFSRLKNRESFEIFEEIEIQKAICQKYKSAVEKYRCAGGRVEVIDAEKSIEEVARQIWNIAAEMPILKQ